MILTLEVKLKKNIAVFCLYFKVQDLLAIVCQPTNAFLLCRVQLQLLLKMLLLIREQLHLFKHAGIHNASI